MGSQTLEILRQGVWASLTGGYFYDPHQGVFCNVVHLYLWLYLLCSPFVAYLYFPSTWLTWCIYCVLTSSTILLVKLLNLALHRLYDRAQTMSEVNLKSQFFKVTKETESRSDDEGGIEMKVMGAGGSRMSVEQAINEASEENSIMSDNVNSTIDLKVEVHRKNSSESVDLMFYAPSMLSGGSQQDQQSLAGSTSISKSIRSTSAATVGNNSNNMSAEMFSKYLTVYPEVTEAGGSSAASPDGGSSGGDSNVVMSTSTAAAAAVTAAAAAAASCSITSSTHTKRSGHLSRKCSEVFTRRHRRRLERQSSLDTAACVSSNEAGSCSTFNAKLMRNQSDTIATTGTSSIAPNSLRNETFLHSQLAQPAKSSTSATAAAGALLPASRATTLRQHFINMAGSAEATPASTSTNSFVVITPTTGNGGGSGSGSGNGSARVSRLQRHRSSETHDERLKHQNRGLFQPLHHQHYQSHYQAEQPNEQQQQQQHQLSTHHSSQNQQQHNASSGASSIGTLAVIGGGISDTEDMEMGLGRSTGGVADACARALQSWILDSSSEVYLEDDSYTKSDLGIEQQPYPHQQSFRGGHHHHHHHHHHLNNSSLIRKDPTSTMSALQLSSSSSNSNRPQDSSSVQADAGSAGNTISLANTTAASSGGSSSGSASKRRRHSNATSYQKHSSQATKAALLSSNGAGSSSSHTQLTGGVRRIKSAALEVLCPQPSVSNLSAHPNSVEAIGGQQQLRNPLPPPSKSLVRNQHLNLYPNYAEGSTCSSLIFGTSSACGSTTALIEPPVYPIVEHTDEKSAPDEIHTTNANDNDVSQPVERHEDDDELDDVPLRRRTRALGCSQTHHSAESDVGGILADNDDDDEDDDDEDDDEDDDDVFKDFDDNLEHILNELQQTHSQLDDVLKTCEVSPQKQLQQQQQQQKPPAPSLSNNNNNEDDDDETDNNTGSRSPLLSERNRQHSQTPREIAADKALREELSGVLQPTNAAAAATHQQQQHQQHQQLHQLQHQPNRSQLIRSEADSGCPSSDCEQVSASSKDQLLSTSAGCGDVAAGGALALDEEQPCTSKMAAKSLGAIPKVVKYREVDELTRNASTSQQLHRRRGGGGGSNGGNSSLSGGWSQDANTCNEFTLICTKPVTPLSTKLATSRTSSSSNSTHSISLSESLTADIHKMLWLMHGGAVDERGRPIAGINADGTPIAANTNMVPSNMSSAHFQFYQDAIQALQTCNNPSSSTEHISCIERALARDKLHLDAKQQLQLQQQQLSDTPSASASQVTNSTVSASISQQPGGSQHAPTLHGMLHGMSSSRTPTALSLQGLFNVIRSERHAASSAVLQQQQQQLGDAITLSGGLGGGGGGSSMTGGNDGPGTNASNQLSQPGSNAGVPMLNVDGHFAPYCDYWRPPCLLSAEKPTAPKSFYKYRFKWCGHEHEFKIAMDRLELLALFDRDLHWLHVLLACVLCTLVACLGAAILQHNYYKDLCAFLFCAVIASAQYSLVKSVQPDAASPVHGFNKTVAYSRAIYFSLTAGLLLLFKRLDGAYAEQPPAPFIFFGLTFLPARIVTLLLQTMYILLLSFPLIFSVGLCPQINTFLMYLLEQIDMHVFGGNAASSLLGSFLCMIRSVLAIMLLYGPLYVALEVRRGTQFILFSIFCAMLIPLGYHLSRSASDFSHIWRLIKTCIVSTYRDDDEELSAMHIGSTGAIAAAATTQSVGGQSNKQCGIKQQQQQQQQRQNAGATVAQQQVSMSKHTHTLSVNSNENIELSSLEKLAIGHEHDDTQEHKRSKSKGSSLGSSQTLGKTISSSKRAITASSSYASIGAAEAQAIVTESGDEERLGATLEAHQHEDANTDTAEMHKNAGELLTDDKISSSSTTNPADMSTLTAGGGNSNSNDATAASGPLEGNQQAGNEASNDNANTESELPDPLPRKLQATVNTRLKNDLVVMTLLAVCVLGLHCSTVFTVLQPDLNIVLYVFIGTLGILLHYAVPQMRKHMPWLCFARPLLRQKEFGLFEVLNAPQIMWFEKLYIYLSVLERNVLFPLLAISSLTADSQIIADKFGVAWGTLIVAVCALKFVRNAYSDPTNQYLIIIFTVLLFRIDFSMATETFIIDYFFVSLAFRKCCDFLLKLQFIVTYIAPWQITWGSAFHAFAQPFSVPHSAMLFLQAAISAILSTPLNPFLGSAIFLTSYVRPTKFWERDYNTRRIDHSNTRLSSQLERDLGADDNNLNSIFYEHLTRSLQHSLCGDLLMGRWGNVNQGDCFVLASDDLNCLVHIIELGNGLCTFQMRGLEFRGTYCQQREVEAITEEVEDNDGCCCYDPGHLPRMLSANAMFSTRWLAWQVVAAQYVVEGYSISDNLASATLQVFEYRKVLITYYIKSIIYYVVKNPKLEQWLAAGPIQDALQHTLSRQFVDLDPIFNFNLDEDFDFRAVGITRSSFCYVYLKWINFCVDKRKETQAQSAKDSTPASMGTAPTVANNNAAAAPPTTNANLATAPPAGTVTTTASSTVITTAPSGGGGAYNDSKSTPNLSIQGASSTPQAKSQSQQQLRSSTRPQKSATMSGSSTVNGNTNESSAEHMSSSHSFANISRQTSESAPGLGGYVTYMDQNVFVKLSSKTSGKAFRKDTDSPRAGDARAATLNINEQQQQVGNQQQQAATVTAPISAQSVNARPTLKLKVASVAKDAPLVSLCLALGLLARRSLATASHSSLTGVEFFLHGLHALFKGDFRITSPRDEWVFADMELLHAVVAPAVKMALKLQQDHITNPDEFLDPHVLYEAIDTCSKELVISHEADPVWRSAVLRGAPNLLALRHVMEDSSDEYRIIRLTKRFLSFRVIKLNRECVRGLWAGQQQELIYLRNRNPERGSIQNAKQALRNIINSSCDQPIGYPIYVSPLTTSYADTNVQLCHVIGGAITLETIRQTLMDWWHHIRERCRQGCSSGSALEASQQLGGVGVGGGIACTFGSGGSGVGTATGSVTGGMTGTAAVATTANSAGGDSAELAPVFISAPLYNTLTVNSYFGVRSGNVTNNLGASYVSDSLAVVRGGLAVMPVKPTSTTLIAGLLNRERDQERSDAVPFRDLAISSMRASSIGMRGCGGQLQTFVPRGRDHERRATLPIASGASAADASSGGGGAGAVIPKEPHCSSCEQTEEDPIGELSYASSPRFTKLSSSSGSLGIGNIITTPGDYPRKTKGPICLTAAALASETAASTASTAMRKPLIEIYKKVIIVDDTNIYDCLDIIDAVVWPNERMRANGGRLSWKDWEPCAGMVGHVVHCWIPNHSDARFRSHVNRCVYLIEIGEHYVPVEELGLREYNQIMGSCEEMANSRRSSIQRDFHEYNYNLKMAGLTPIIGGGSSLESNRSHKPKIQAVSSSSSEDEDIDGVDVAAQADAALMEAFPNTTGMNLVNFNRLLGMWKAIADKKKQAAANASAANAEDDFEGFDYTGELPPELLLQLSENPQHLEQQLELTETPTETETASTAVEQEQPLELADPAISAAEAAAEVELSAEAVQVMPKQVTEAPSPLTETETNTQTHLVSEIREEVVEPNDDEQATKIDVQMSTQESEASAYDDDEHGGTTV